MMWVTLVALGIQYALILLLTKRLRKLEKIVKELREWTGHHDD